MKTDINEEINCTVRVRKKEKNERRMEETLKGEEE